MKIKINPIQNLPFKAGRQTAFKINKTRAENYNDNYSNKWKAHAGIDIEKGEMSINAATPGAIDSDIFYVIKADGSGEIYNCWSPNSIKYEQGTLSNVYNRALEMSGGQSGKISNEQSNELLDLAREYATPDYQIKNS